MAIVSVTVLRSFRGLGLITHLSYKPRRDNIVHQKTSMIPMVNPLAITVHLTNLELALESIRRANIAHPDDQLLECFLRDSVEPDAAARYLLCCRHTLQTARTPQIGARLLQTGKGCCQPVSFPCRSVRSKLKLTWMFKSLARRRHAPCRTVALRLGSRGEMVAVAVSPTSRTRLGIRWASIPSSHQRYGIKV